MILQQPSEYPEINQLLAYFERAKISFVLKERIDEENHWAQLLINSKQWDLFILDEYQDFDPEYPLACLFLVLTALEEYEESTDFLNWSTSNGLDTSSPRLLDYYRGLSTSLNQIKSVLGAIDPCINPLDYQLRTGVIQALRHYPKSLWGKSDEQNR